MLSRFLVKKKIEKLRALYDKVKSHLPTDFSFEYGDGYNSGHISDLISNMNDINASVRMVCNKKFAEVWITYFNSAYDELKKYDGPQKKINNRRKNEKH